MQAIITSSSMLESTSNSSVRHNSASSCGTARESLLHGNPALLIQHPSKCFHGQQINDPAESVRHCVDWPDPMESAKAGCRAFSRSRICSRTRSNPAPIRSILLIRQIRGTGTCWPDAKPSHSALQRPSTALKITTAPSRTRRLRSTSAVKVDVARRVDKIDRAVLPLAGHCG
jgi:hypothetical protein